MALHFSPRRIHEGSLAFLFLAGVLTASSPAQTTIVDNGQTRTTTDGRQVQQVQYRQSMRPVYTSVAPTYAAPMMAAPVFTRPVMNYINGWQPTQQPATTYVQQPAATYVQQPAATYAQPAQVASYGDPYGFTSWLNSIRAQYGLGAVSYDANLTNWASSNNAAQQSRGMGHHVMGPARRQNSAIGSAASIGGQWMNSPAHRAALLDPTIRAIGIAGAGMYWTFNAY